MPVEDFDTPVKTVDGLYRQFADELRVFFKRRAGTHAAEDFVQHLFLRLLNCQDLSQVRDPRLYLYRIAWNLLYTENKRLKYEAPLLNRIDLQEPEESPASNSSLWDLEKIDDLIDLELALQAFKPEQRTAFLLYWNEGYTCEEVASKTGLNIHTVRKYVAQMMIRIRKSHSTNGLCNR